MLILGIDEAGRGPILGPMVLAGVLLTPRQAATLTRAGVADSKRFTGPRAHEARSALVPVILRAATAVCLRVVSVPEIDRYTTEGQLNALERAHAEVIIRRVGGGADRILCDGERLFAPLRAHHRRLEAVDRAESCHAAVAAASLLAKVRRDELFHCIARRYRGEFGDLPGGGYVNTHTRRFLDAYRTRYGDLPPEARRSWQARGVQLELLS